MLIDSENLIARIDKCYQESAKTGLGLEPVMAIRDIKALISVMPEVEAVPVKHGKWEYVPTDGKFRAILICSKCKRSVGEYDRYKFCPHCGAMMDLEG